MLKKPDKISSNSKNIICFNNNSGSHILGKMASVGSIRNLNPINASKDPLNSKVNLNSDDCEKTNDREVKSKDGGNRSVFNKYSHSSVSSKDPPTRDRVVIPVQTDFRAGILKDFLQTWKSFTKDPTALNAVAGVRLPLRRPPPLKCPTQVILS